MKTKRRIKAGTLIFAGILATVMIAGCSLPRYEKQDTDTTTPSRSEVVTEATEGNGSSVSAESVYQVQIEYYEKLIADLEDRLLASREDSFIESAEYKQTIAALEESIRLLEGKLEEISANTSAPQPPSGTLDGSNPSQSDKVEPIPSGKEETVSPTPSSPTEITHSSPFEYEIKGGEITIIKYKGRDSAVTVPDSISGFPVVAIGEEAFKDTEIQKIALPEGIKKIDWFAFSGCTSLCEITIPSSVSSISYGAFDGCSGFLVIRCDSGSYAERFAASWGILAVTK